MLRETLGIVGIAVSGALMALHASKVEAASVGIEPASQVVAVGEMFTAQIVASNFTAEDALSGGVAGFRFNDLILRVNSVSVDPYFDFLPDAGAMSSAGLWSGIGFDVFVNPPVAGDGITIATIEFTAIAHGLSLLDIEETSTFFGDNTEIMPTLTESTVSAVPVPAAVWLFGSSLIGLVALRRRRRFR